MKKIFLLIMLITVLYSCSKEKSVDNTDPNSGGGPANTVLVKTSIKVGADSAVNTYGYDNQKRIISQKFNGTINVMEDYGQTTITRNGQGVIERIITVEDGSGGEQVEYRVQYDAASKRYISKSSSVVYQGITLKDSIAYSYNAAGQISQEVYYINEGSGYFDYAKTEYMYAANNLTAAKYYYKNATNTYQQSATINYEFDSKTAALSLGAEAILLEQFTFVSANNITKLSYTDLEDATQNEVVTFAYTYNSANKPTAASIIIQSVGVPIPMTYFYN